MAHPSQADPSQPFWSAAPEWWEEAHTRIARLASARHRATFTRLVDHVRAGWEIIAPLQARTHGILYGGALSWPAANDVAAFLEMEPTDTFLWIVRAAVDAVPRGPGDGVELEDIQGEATELVRALRIVYMAAAHPEFPAELGEVVREVYPRMAEWRDGLAAAIDPVDALAGRCAEGERIPFLAGPLRVLA